MKPLLTRKPKRFFAFGCSFTNYCFPTWADIIALELKVPYWNYGQSGAGNQYIFNMLMQADCLYQFNKDDLVIVEWTNIAREDRYLMAKQKWVSPGNIYSASPSRDEYEFINDTYIEKWADPFYYALRDFAIIKAAIDFFDNKKVQYHQLKMIDLEMFDHFQPNKSLENVSKELLKLYNPYLSHIEKSFYDVLWNNDLRIKYDMQSSEIGPFFKDGHPSVMEHLKYLQTVFDCEFSKDTIEQSKLAHSTIIDILKTLKVDSNTSKWSSVLKFPQEIRIAQEFSQDKKGFY